LIVLLDPKSFKHVWIWRRCTVPFIASGKIKNIDNWKLNQKWIYGNDPKLIGTNSLVSGVHCSVMQSFILIYHRK
jgi:hypothetical protein